MTDSNLRSKASAGVSAHAISDRHAVVRIELAVAINWRCSTAEQRAGTMHTAGARVETMISGTVRIDPFGGRACGAPDEDENGSETAHLPILAGALVTEIPTNNSIRPWWWRRRAIVSPMDDQLAILARFEAQILLPASAARMHRLKLVVPRRQRLVHRRPSPDGTAINVKRGSLCGGGEGYEGNLRRPIPLGLHRCRALRVTAHPGVRSPQPSAVCHQVAGSESGAMPVAHRGSGRRRCARLRASARHRQQQAKHHRQEPPPSCTLHEHPR
jgi:hypothetical protein